MIRLLCRDSRAHVCIHDVEGVLRGEELQLPPSMRIHATAFCDHAKSTTLGNSLCLRIKTHVNRTSLCQTDTLCGCCPYGLYELVRPVVFGGKTVCIIYISHLVRDRDQSIRRLRSTCTVTGVDSQQLENLLLQAQEAPSLEAYEHMARALESYILLLLQQTGWQKQPRSGCQRKAREVAEYIDANYSQDLSLKQLADLYFVNEKYLGKVFRTETGETMRQYLTRVRLNHAAKMLRTSDRSILSIALDCGFQNVPYFNRCFLEAYRMTPSEYRQAAQE